MIEDISFSVPNNDGDPVRVGAWRFTGEGCVLERSLAGSAAATSTAQIA